ncbi:murein biosynthesis integral membrane protein MurJ [Saccharothrix sp. ST-888]|uniref:murein biosynthesis integral membrane protein MurJ n=1 Tax=Saccharothrix sp. ST-888 TaxID=1427391 RepID=UPI0005EC2743|nr:murein biosynthesis integral membrane protein MurJ [Saccharothrix sp. ST-888]
MSERSEARAQGQGQGRSQAHDRAAGPAPTGSPQAAEPATADWYVADTYAQDPYAADPYGGSADQDPYGVQRAAEAAETSSSPLPPQPAHRPEPSLTAPAPRWASAAIAGLPDEPEPGPAESARQGSPWDTETTEYVGVDALLSTAGAKGGTGGTGSETSSGTVGGKEPAEERPFVPPIEFDPPLSEVEATLRVTAAQVPAEADVATDLAAEAALETAEAASGAASGTASEGSDVAVAVAVAEKPPVGPEADAAPRTAPAPPADGPGSGGGSDTGGGKAGGLLNSSAVMAAGTLVSRGTGFLRTMVIAAAIGVGTMGDSYNAANTLPTLLYILIGGGALNAVFVPQLVRSMKQDEDGGTAYANRLLTLVMTGLAGVVFVAVLGAPLLVQLISHSLMRDQASADTTVALARYCLPTIFFMGVHVVMGQILNARGRFGAMMWTPVLNNIVVIFTFGAYIWVFGTFQHSEVTPAAVSPEGIRLLGLGTLLGLAVQALSMIPYLRASGFRFKPRFDWRGHGLGKAARLAKWTFLFVLANQAGYLVVTQLATAAGRAAESKGYLGVGLAAYSNALLIWQLPMAVITVSVMSAVLPRLSRSAADHDPGAVRDDLSYGLRTSAVAIVPAAFLFLALGPVIGNAIYGLGNGGSVAHGTTAVGYMLSAFALGLIPYSVQYVLLRGFYAYEDTRTPFSNTVWVAACQAGTAVLCYLVLPAQLAVTGMALGYGASYAVGVAVALPKLKARIGGLDTARIAKTYVRLAIASVPAAVVGLAFSLLLHGGLNGWPGSVLTLVVAGSAQLVVFAAIARRMRIEELNAMIGMVRSRLGR